MANINNIGPGSNTNTPNKKENVTMLQLHITGFGTGGKNMALGAGIKPPLALRELEGQRLGLEALVEESRLCIAPRGHGLVPVKPIIYVGRTDLPMSKKRNVPRPVRLGWDVWLVSRGRALAMARCRWFALPTDPVGYRAGIVRIGGRHAVHRDFAMTRVRKRSERIRMLGANTGRRPWPIPRSFRTMYSIIGWL